MNKHKSKCKTNRNLLHRQLVTRLPVVLTAVITTLFIGGWAHALSRTDSFQQWSFGLGPSSTQRMNNENMFYALTIGRHWETNDRAEIRARGHIALPNREPGQFMMGTIGSSYFLTAEDIAPYVGAEFGLGRYSGNGLEARNGFAGAAYAGLRFFRQSTAQLSVELFYRSIFIGEHPANMGAQLSVLF